MFDSPASGSNIAAGRPVAKTSATMMPRHSTPPAAAQRARSNARSFAATRQAARKTAAGSSMSYSTPCSVAAGSADHSAEVVPSAIHAAIGHAGSGGMRRSRSNIAVIRIPAASERRLRSAGTWARGRMANKAATTHASPCFIASGKVMSPEQAGGGREHRLDADGMHAARLGAFVGRALAAPHPFDAPLEKRALVAAGKVWHRYFAIRGVPPEFAAAKENRRPGPEQHNGRNRDELRQVGNPGV